MNFHSLTLSTLYCLSISLSLDIVSLEAANISFRAFDYRSNDTSNETILRPQTFNRFVWNFIVFSVFRTRFRCFTYVYHARQCTPFLKQENEVSDSTHETNRIIWHATTLVSCVARCPRWQPSALTYTAAVLSADREIWDFPWTKKRSRSWTY